MIYVGVHKVENHRCKVIEYTIKIGKICIHVIPKYTNYGAKYQNIIFRCLTKLKIQAEA